MLLFAFYFLWGILKVYYTIFSFSLRFICSVCKNSCFYIIGDNP
jgi:hypothetical protein